MPRLVKPLTAIAVAAASLLLLAPTAAQAATSEVVYDGRTATLTVTISDPAGFADVALNDSLIVFLDFSGGATTSITFVCGPNELWQWVTPFEAPVNVTQVQILSTVNSGPPILLDATNCGTPAVIPAVITPVIPAVGQPAPPARVETAAGSFVRAQ